MQHLQGVAPREALEMLEEVSAELVCYPATRSHGAEHLRAHRLADVRLLRVVMHLHHHMAQPSAEAENVKMSVSSTQ